MHFLIAIKDYLRTKPYLLPTKLYLQPIPTTYTYIPITYYLLPTTYTYIPITYYLLPIPTKLYLLYHILTVTTFHIHHLLYMRSWSRASTVYAFILSQLFDLRPIDTLNSFFSYTTITAQCDTAPFPYCPQIRVVV